jgi:hypothetical protein
MGFLPNPPKTATASFPIYWQVKGQRGFAVFFASYY